MKDEPIRLSAKSPKERFHELGSKLMTVPKDEIDALDKKWHQAKNKARKRKRHQ